MRELYGGDSPEGRGAGRCKFGGCRGEPHNSTLHSFAPRSTITGIRNAALKPWKKSAHYLKAVFSASLRIPPTLSSMSGLGVSVSFFRLRRAENDYFRTMRQ